MPGRARYVAVACFALSIWLSAEVPASAGVSVHLTNGKQLHADRVGPKSTARFLELRVERSGAIVARKLSWERVVSAQIDGRLFSGKELRQRYLSRLAADEVDGNPSRQVQAVSHSQLDRVDQFELPIEYGLQRVDAPSASCCTSPRGRLISVRDDPLSAYSVDVARFFPNGVPLSEAGFVLELMRTKKVDDVLRPVIRPALPEQSPSGFSPPVERRPIRPDQLQAISVTARPISTQGKADWDALAVSVHGINKAGLPARLEGTLQIVLFGRAQQLLNSHGDYFVSSPGRVRRLATWTRRVTHPGHSQSAFALAGEKLPANVFVLPLPRPLPDHDLRVAPYGELKVELLAPGQGVFVASQPGLVLRHLSAVRDGQLFDTGSRFLLGESTSDSLMRVGALNRRPLTRDVHRKSGWRP